jgi:putative phage-type endonuclease
VKDDSPSSSRKRSSFMGASDIAAALGISPYTTPVELYLRKRDGFEIDDKPVLRRGRRLEPYVRDIYAEESGRVVMPPRFVVGTEPWICANLDGESGPSMPTVDRVLEIKSANEFTRRDWGEAGSDAVPVFYTAQCQWQMMITGHKLADLAALIGLDDFRIFTIEADVDIQAMLLVKAREFWQRVQDGIPPEPQTTADVARLFPKHELGAVVEANDVDLSLITELKHLREQISAGEEREEMVKRELMRRIGPAEAMTMDGVPLITWKAQERKTVDVKALRAAHPEVVEQFERVSNTKVFRVK